MDSSIGYGSSMLLLITLSLICLQSTAEIKAGSVLFIDSPMHQYLRSPPSDQSVETTTSSMSVLEVGAAVSVLLGLAPPPTLSTASSSKLNQLLMPNPFDRPRHVFMLEVGLAADSQAVGYTGSDVFSSAIKSKLISSSGSVEIELPDRKDIVFSSLDGPDSDSYRAVTDKDISDFASSFDGSYISNNVEPLNGELIISLPGGSKMNLHMSKKADRTFAIGLIYMMDNIRKVMEMKQDVSGGDSNVAEFVGGYLDGIKALQEEYGSKGIAQQGMDLLLTTVSRVFDSLQEKYKGQVVAVILFSKADSSQPHKMLLDVTFASSSPSRRWLEDVKTMTPNSTAEIEAAVAVALVRRTLAWITGIILLIATFVGVYLLVNMPLTRDTLLYSNVKLD